MVMTLTNSGRTEAASKGRRSMVQRYAADTAFMTFVAILMAFLYIPIWVLIVFSFNDSRSLTWPLTGFTLEWYEKLWNNSQLLDAIGNSFYVASCATVLTLLVGVPAALALHRVNFPGKKVFRRLVVLPITLPGVVTGISMLNLFRLLGFNLSLETVILGHATALLAVVVTQVAARLERLPKSLEEASADLGAPPLHTFLHVTLPNIRSAVIGAGPSLLRALLRRDPGHLLPDRAGQHAADVHLFDDAPRRDAGDQRGGYADRALLADPDHRGGDRHP